MRRCCVIVLVVAAAVGCAPANRAPRRAASPAAATPATYDGLLAQARSAADQARGVKPLSSAEFDALEGDETRVAELLVRWAEARRGWVFAADEAYGRAVRAARDPDEVIVASSEAADAWVDLMADATTTALASVPAKYRQDPQMVDAVHSAASDALGEARAEALAHVARCRRAAWVSSPLRGGDTRCRSTEDKLGAASKTKTSPADEVACNSRAAPLLASTAARSNAPVARSALVRMNRLYGDADAPAGPTCDCKGVRPMTLKPPPRLSMELR